MAEGGGEGHTAGVHTGTPDVFISYASQDAVLATTVVEALERSGVACWIAPRNVTPGAFYADEIVHAIDAAKAIVLILSKNAADSQHVLREVEGAASKRHPVVSLRIDQAPLPAGLEYFLNTSQWLDASGGEIARSMPKLIAAVRIAIQAPVVTPAATPTPRGPVPPPSARPAKHTTIIVASLIGLAIAGFAVDRLWVSSRGAASSSVPTAAVPPPAPAPAAQVISEKSVAVLPFIDMSEKKDQEYFSDGLSEELIDMLTKIPDLRVPARTSSFYFKGKQATIADIAKALGVAHVLEGSVRKSGNTLRITAQLIRVDSGYHLWSETYDRQFGDIFKIQDDIAGAVVNALKVSLIGGKVPNTVSTRNAEAYALYLQARAIDSHDTSKRQLEGAADDLRKAVAFDPAFIGAWTQLVIILCHQVRWWNVQPQAVSAEVYRANERVHALGPESAYAHEAMAQVHLALDRDWRGAAAEFARAHELDPTDADNTRRLADMTASITGDNEAALPLYLKAIELDPVNVRNYQLLARAYDNLGRFADAEASLRKALELEPTFPGLHAQLGFEMARLGRQNEALAEIQKEMDEQFRWIRLAAAYTALGRKADADAALAVVEQRYATSSPLAIAELHAVRGNVDQAFNWLNRACLDNPECAIFIKPDSDFNNIRGDPRYKALLRKMNLPE